MFFGERADISQGPVVRRRVIEIRAGKNIVVLGGGRGLRAARCKRCKALFSSLKLSRFTVSLGSLVSQVSAKRGTSVCLSHRAGVTEDDARVRTSSRCDCPAES